jgi:hypothetical protein
MIQSGNGGKKLEGEGSSTGTRGYNAKLKQHAREQDVDKLADDARRALEGPEGPELERANQAARKGPGTPSKKKP